MPSNVIDSLVVTLGLDNSDFRHKQRETQDDLKRVRESSKSTAVEMEASGKRASSYFRSLRNEVAGLFLAFAGASTLKDFVGQIIAGDAATGRLANNMGIATEQLSAWEGAITRVGGSAKDADSALQAMTTAFQNYKLTGTTGNDADLQGLGVSLNDLQNPTTALLKIAEAGERMSRPEFVARLQRIGLSPEAINLLERGRGGVEALLREQEKLGVVNDQNAQAAQRLQDKWAQLSSLLKGEARPQITAAITTLTDMATAANDAKTPIDALLGSINALANGLGVASGVMDAFKHEYRAWQLLKQGDFAGANREDNLGLKSLWNARNDPLFGNSSKGQYSDDFRRRMGSPIAGQLTGGGGNAEAYFQSQGFTPEQARGIAAGIHAEGGGLGMAANGAFGIGQWRGSRQRELFRRYGLAPSRQQQLEFLSYELKGGDPGGAAVRGAGSADSALLAYVQNFMRPAAGAETFGDIRRGRAFLGGTRPMAPMAGSSSPVTIGQITVYSPDAQSFANKDLPDAMRKRGLVIQAGSGMRQ